MTGQEAGRFSAIPARQSKNSSFPFKGDERPY